MYLRFFVVCFSFFGGGAYFFKFIYFFIFQGGGGGMEGLFSVIISEIQIKAKKMISLYTSCFLSKIQDMHKWNKKIGRGWEAM